MNNSRSEYIKHIKVSLAWFWAGSYDAVFDNVKPCHLFHQTIYSHIELALFDCLSSVPGPGFHCAPDFVDIF